MAHGSRWRWVKTLVPSEPQNSWDLWMFIPLKMVCIGIDPYPAHEILWIESKPTSFHPFHQVQILHGILAKNSHIDQLPKLSGFRVRGCQLRVHVGYRYALLCQKLSKLLENHPKIIQKSSKNHPNPENDQNFGHLQTKRPRASRTVGRWTPRRLVALPRCQPGRGPKKSPGFCWSSS